MSTADPRVSGGVTYRLLRELGSRSQHAYAAIREPHELVVAQRFARITGVTAGNDATPLDAPSMALLLRDARCLSKNWHPNIARVRHVDLAGSELTIASELVDGATLADLASLAPLSPRERGWGEGLLPVFARVMIDMLTGLHALHGLRDGMNTLVGAIHGELCPANVVVGRDGVTRIIDVLRSRPVRLSLPSEAVGYAAPEALEGHGTEDPRADVYAAGAILWEALAGCRLFDEDEPARVLARQRECEIPLPPIDPTSPFARLAEIAMCALAFDPARRFRGVTEMAAEIRSVARAHLASGSAVAAHVAALAGDRIRTRRALLDPATSGTRRRADEQSDDDDDIATQKAPSCSPPSLRPILSPPVPLRSTRLRASPRVVAPTVATEIPQSLLAASRPSLSDHQDDFVADEEDEEELPGPRGSSPELDLEAAIAAAIVAARATPVGRPPAISPVTPNVPFFSATPPLAVRRAPAQATNETPGELVVPIVHAPAPPPRTRGRMALVVMALLVVLATGASIAMRRSGDTPAAVSAEPPPAATDVLPPPVRAPAAKPTK